MGTGIAASIATAGERGTTKMTDDIALAGLYFFVAFFLARLQMGWLRAREERKALTAANLDAMMTLLHYVPIALLIVSENWWVIGADVAANWLASYLGVKELPCGDEDEEE